MMDLRKDAKDLQEGLAYNINMLKKIDPGSDKLNYLTMAHSNMDTVRELLRDGLGAVKDE